jgi:hypothetical protein
MKERGYQQAKRFSWEISVRRVLDVYRNVTLKEARDARQQQAAD